MAFRPDKVIRLLQACGHCRLFLQSLEYMRKSRIAALLLLATATLAQQQQTVEITSEPSHHLVFQNEFVRVFDVTIPPKTSSLVHRHNYDYLFVTLGDSDVLSVRPGEKPVQLLLKDGEVRFTPGNFAHAAVNQVDRPFHNITIELLKPSSKIATCADACLVTPPCASEKKESCAAIARSISSDQWTMSLVTMSPSSRLERHTHSMPHLVVAVSDLNLTQQSPSATSEIKRVTGDVAWVPAGVTHTVTNRDTKPAQYVTLEFKTESK
jgi:quercetin dioxygenase-like cupin family protein